MQSKRTWLFLTALSLVIAGCGGSGSGGTAEAPGELSCPGQPGCTRPDDNAAGSRCGGIDGQSCRDDEVCVDIDDACDPAVGADCPGECQAVVSPPIEGCRQDTDCRPLECQVCPTGERFCPEPTCLDGSCFEPVLDCPMPPPPPGCGGFPGVGCPDGFECVDDPNDDCGAGPAADCPGICVPPTRPSCDDDSDCPPVRVPCSICADGSSSCPRTYCDQGQCNLEMGACPQPQTCGGIGGFECPPGFLCIEGRNPDCDPAVGVDCGGFCVPDSRPDACGGFAGIVCPDGQECVDDPSDECDPNHGGADCGGICQPIVERCREDADCPALRVPCSFCPDGNEVCGSSSCVEGRCLVAYPSCPAPVGCEGDPSQCKPGYHCVALPIGCDPMIGEACPPAPSVCIPDENVPRRCNGFAGEVCAPGYRCEDDPMDDCDPNQGGADCGGICVPDQNAECRSDGDCPQILAPCTQCADGSFACPHSYCRDGQCSASFDRCEEPKRCDGIAGFVCPEGLECVDDPSDNCDPATGADCGGICVPLQPPPPHCTSDEECAVTDGPCRVCPDGTAVCPQAACLDGQCHISIDECPFSDFCGGIAGFPCAEGYECIDNPGDDCDPNQGGADCGGICVPREQAPPCRSDSECASIEACQSCDDGTAACARASCVNGACISEFPACSAS